VSTRTRDLVPASLRASGRFDSVEYRHADVHQYDVGLELSDALDRLGPVDGLSDDLDVVLSLEDHS
jgi:hypothetical protein